MKVREQFAEQIVKKLLELLLPGLSFGRNLYNLSPPEGSLKRGTMRTLARAVLTSLFLIFVLIAGGFADEGMWTMDNLPLKEIKQRYGFDISGKWAERVQKSSARLPNCSSSFVSGDGLLMTNGHCAEEAVQALSTARRNIYKNGFYARTQAEELKTNLTVMVLMFVLTPEQESIYRPEPGIKCEPVSLYQGAVKKAYCYKVYNDIRLVFSSEKNTWFFGGDADNFEFPRYALDAAFLRAYEDGKPAKTPNHFKWSKSGAAEGELIFVSGHPGNTQRLLTASALATERDVRAPFILDLARRREITLQQFMLKGAEQRRIAESDLFSWQNTRKLYAGKVYGLQDWALSEKKEFKEIETYTTINANDPVLGKQFQEGIKLVEEAQEVQRALYPVMLLYVRGLGFDTRLYDYALSIVSGNKQNARAIFEKRKEEAPLNLEYEKSKLTDSVSHLIEVMKIYDPKIQSLFNYGYGPKNIAAELIEGSRLRELKGHEELLGDNAPDDPMLYMARRVTSSSRAYSEKWNQALAKEKLGYSKIADVMFKYYGTMRYPDATFTLRLSYGKVRGYEENAKQVPAWTTIGGAYRHSAKFGNAGDWKLPSRWVRQKQFVNMRTPLNFVSDLDITGGNSGSPVFNKDLEIVGLVFDGNIHSLVSDYDYDYSARSRAVSVHLAGMIEILKKIYRADRLVNELTGR